MIIKNSVELTEKLGKDPSRWAFKNTDTGVALQSSIEGVTVTPYIEGEDGETHSSRFMSYPFTLRQLNTLVDLADIAAGRWKESHEYCYDWARSNHLSPWYGEDLSADTWRFQIYVERTPYPKLKTTYYLWQGNSAVEALKMFDVMLTRIFEETYPDTKIEDISECEAGDMLAQQGILLGMNSR